MDFKKELKNIQKALLTGTSYMMPLVVAGGLSFAISLLGGETTNSGIVVANEFMANVKIIGKAGLFMMIPVAAAYVAYAIAGRPGLAPAFILGYIANDAVGSTGAKTGFLGAVVMGILAGYMAKWMKGWNVSKSVKSIMPILVIPLVTTFVLGVLYIYVISVPLGAFMNWFIEFLGNLNGANQIIFALVIGALCEIDMGGPITKTVTMFTSALIAEGIYAPNGMYRVCPALPPLAILLCTIIFKNKWTQGDKDAAKSIGLMGFFGLTEGAIPFAIADFKAVIPANVIGCMVASLIACLTGVESPVPHGGFITAPMVNKPIMYIVAQIVGIVVSALIMGVLKKPVEETTPKKVEE